MAQSCGLRVASTGNVRKSRFKEYCRSGKRPDRYGPDTNIPRPGEAIAAASSRSVQPAEPRELLCPGFSGHRAGDRMSGCELEQSDLRQDPERFGSANHADRVEVCVLM